MEEKVFLQEGNIIVTSARFIVPSQTYAMSGITSVKLAEKTPSKAVPLILIFIGLLVFIGNGLKGEGIIAGLISAVPGVIWLMKLKSSHIVALTVSSGEVKALESKDRAFIVNVVNALNEAIVHRG